MSQPLAILMQIIDVRPDPSNSLNTLIEFQYGLRNVPSPQDPVLTVSVLDILSKALVKLAVTSAIIGDAAGRGATLSSDRIWSVGTLAL
jgi:hypothetical protein